MSLQKFEDKKGCVIMIAILLLLGGLFWNSFYWPEGLFLKRQKLLLIALIIGIAVAVLVILKIQQCNLAGNWIIERAKVSFCWVKENRKKIGVFVGILLISAVICGGAVFIYGEFGLHKGFNVKLFYSLMACACVGLTGCFVYRSAAKRPEHIFAIFALIMGCYAIVITPTRVGISWDDEIHYARTLEISNYLNGIMYQADEKNIGEYATNIYAAGGYDQKSDIAYDEALNTSYKNKEYSIHGFDDYGVWSVAYIPAAMGIIIGRGLQLSYIGVFNMGRLFNLLTYILLIYCAIKKAKYGKAMLVAIGLIPTTIFMAANYSYDAWVVGFTILGFSHFFAALQSEEKLENKDMLIIVGTILLGCMPKAIYFPLLFPLLFMPKDKFKNRRQRTIYYCAVIGVGIVLVASFILPMLIKGGDVGDARGGAGVNAREQIKFILYQPLSYAKILAKFELEYVGIRNITSMLQKLAYVGNGYFGVITSLIIFSLAFFDREEEIKNHLLVRFTSLTGNFAALILSTTALYISFNAVGNGTVAGMQARYMLPLAYPALDALGFKKIPNRINKNMLVCIPAVVLSLSFVVNMIILCAVQYY